MEKCLERVERSSQLCSTSCWTSYARRCSSVSRGSGCSVPPSLSPSRTASSPSSSSHASARLGSSTYREESQWRRINCGWVLGAPPHGRDVGRSSLFAWTCFPYQHAWRVQVWVHRVQECNDRCLRVRRSSQRSLRNIDGSWSGSRRQGKVSRFCSTIRVEFWIGENFWRISGRKRQDGRIFIRISKEGRNKKDFVEAGIFLYI